MKGERLEKHIGRRVEFWRGTMDLGFIAVHNFFSDEEVPQTAEVLTNWEYREAAIIWYRSNCENLSPAEIDEVVVHELSHVLVAPMSDHLPNKHHKLEEFVVESISRAIIKSYGK